MMVLKMSSFFVIGLSQLLMRNIAVYYNFAVYYNTTWFKVDRVSVEIFDTFMLIGVLTPTRLDTMLTPTTKTLPTPNGG